MSQQFATFQPVKVYLWRKQLPRYGVVLCPAMGERYWVIYAEPQEYCGGLMARSLRFAKLSADSLAKCDDAEMTASSKAALASLQSDLQKRIAAAIPELF